MWLQRQGTRLENDSLSFWLLRREGTLFGSVKLSSVQDGIYALGNVHMHFIHVALEAVPKFVRLVTSLCRPFKEDRRTNLSTSASMV